MGSGFFGVRRAHIAVLLMAVHLGASVARAADAGEQPVLSRVYPVGSEARELIQDGTLRSPTIAKLSQTIFHSDWYVIIEARPCPGNPTLYGCLAHQVQPFLDGLSLRLFINPNRGSRSDMLATLGHELRHAVEVIQAGNVRTTSDMLELFYRIGSVTRRGIRGPAVYETEDAERAGSAVRKELREADAALVARAQR